MKKSIIYLVIMISFGLQSCELDSDFNGSISGMDLQPKACFIFEFATIPCDTDCLVSFDASCSENEESYSWDFGDGKNNSSTLINPDYTYETPGIYTVELEVVKNNIKHDTTIVVNIVAPGVSVSGFEIGNSSNNMFVPSEVSFINTSINADTYEWDFNDPTSSNNVSIEENPSHIFENAGSYNVSLKVTNSASGANDNFSLELAINSARKWSVSYGGSTDENGESIIETTNGDFMAVGMTESFTKGKDDMYLVRLDGTNGSLLGPNSVGANFGGSEDDRAFDIIEKEDGGFLIIGFTESFGTNAGQGNQDRNIIVVVTDFLGFQIGEAIPIGKGRNDEAYKIIKMSNGNYAVVGYGSETGEGSGSFLLTVVDDDGQPAPGFNEPKYFGSNFENDVVYDVIEDNNELFIVGRTRTCGEGIGWMLITTLNGIETSSNCEFTYPSVNEIRSIVKTETGFALLGRDQSGTERGVIIFTDDSGNTVGSSVILSENGQETFCFSMTISENGMLAITGSTLDVASGRDAAYFKLYDPMTSSFVSTTLHTLDEESPSSGKRIIATNDGGFAIVGSFSDAGNDDIYIIKTDRLGNAN